MSSVSSVGITRPDTYAPAGDMGGTGDGGGYMNTMEQYSTYASYSGIGLSGIVFILLVIAVIVLWIRFKKLASNASEYLIIRTSYDKSTTVPDTQRNIIFINESRDTVSLTVQPKTENVNDSDTAGGNQLLVKNTKGGTVELYGQNGLIIRSGGLDDGKIVCGNSSALFIWTDECTLLRMN